MPRSRSAVRTPSATSPAPSTTARFEARAPPIVQRDIHRGGAHRGRVLPQRGLPPHAAAGDDGGGERGVEHGVGGSRGVRRLQRPADLAQDLGFPEHL